MVKAMLRCAAGSHPGRVRNNNEDSFFADAERGIFLVVDGIGGQAAGEKAAAIAVERIRARLERQTGTVEQRVREAIAMANKEILAAARGTPEWAGMACVLTLAVLENGSAVIGHVGDSRLYHMRRGSIRKITHDHSPVGEREDARELTEAEAMRHPRRNEVFRDVGSEEHTPNDPDFIELLRIPFEPDSALLLCSDGLSDQVASDDIRRTVERYAADPENAVQALIEAANAAGGKDNVTVVLVEGEQFKASAPLPVAAASEGSPLLGHVLWFLAGILLACAAGWFTRPYWQPPPVYIEPRVWVVGHNEPINTITQALAKARPGDTVEVLPGEYHEPIRLKSGVNLRSRTPREAVLEALGVAAPVIYGEGVSSTRISGFHIQGDPKETHGAAGIVLVNSSVEIDDVEIDGTSVGIEIRGSGRPVLTANGIHDCLGEGLLISGPSTPWLSHNSFQRNKTAGLVVRDGAQPTLIGNVFEKNAIDLPPEIPLTVVKEHNYLIDVKPLPAARREHRK
jgi:serine/threonine protein phosphatase PrpC